YKRIDKALYWLEKAARYGHAEAYIELGSLHSDDNEFVYDQEKTMEFFKKAADLEYGPGCFQLAEIYSNLSWDDAISYYKSAADSGIGKAQLTLGKIYWYGTNTSADISTAVEYLQMAADQNIKEAQE